MNGKIDRNLFKRKMLLNCFWTFLNIGQFTEDGSFIGQYVPGKLQPPVSPQLTSNASPILYTSAPAVPTVKGHPSPPPVLGSGQTAGTAAGTLNQTTASTGTNTNPSATYV